jgi:hypothetical protein
MRERLALSFGAVGLAVKKEVLSWHLARHRCTSMYSFSGPPPVPFPFPFLLCSGRRTLRIVMFLKATWSVQGYGRKDD